MQFSTLIVLVTAVVGATAAPAMELETRSGGIECSKQDGKWKYGWEGAEPSEQYICATGGLLNILNCVSVLNGNTVSIPISILGL
ncbi:hypothetical protein Q7P37_003031 [Cladosporium fusiforme]